MTTPHQYLFVYGTLRPGSGHPMHQVVADSGELVGLGTVRGGLFDLGRYPGLVTGRGFDAIVLGEAYRLTPATADATLGRLDRYEGLEYRRLTVDVTLEDGRVLGAWTYVLQRDPSGLRQISSGDFLNP